MKSICLALLLAGLTAQPSLAQSAATDAPAVDPARLALGREIVDVVLPPAQREQMMASILNSMMQNMVAGMSRGLGLDKDLANKPEVKAVFDRFVERQRSLGLADIKAALPGLVDAYAHAYARNFSLDELKAVRTFLQTPAGASFVQRAPALVADPDVAGWQRRLTEQAATRQQAEVKRLVDEIRAVSSREGGNGK